MGGSGENTIRTGRGRSQPARYHGRTPLLFAARYRHEGVVKSLLGRAGANADKPDNHCQTPFFFAAGFGHDRVVKMLLGQEGINPNKPDN